LKLYPKKSLGQNYLIDENICRKIVNSFDIKKFDHVIEIGPGQGAITKFIEQETKNLAVIELDSKNCEILESKFPGLKIINEDFLKTDLIKFSSGNKLRIIGNIPYNITSEIIFKLIDNRSIIKDAQLMLQDEVAKRLTAKPNSKEYGIPSVFVQVFSKPKLLFKVPGSCFYPRPNVDSRIIHFDFSKSIENIISNAVFFKRFVKSAFSSRRKTLKNSLGAMNLDLAKIDFDFGRRAESLTVDEFINLSNLFNNLTPNPPLHEEGHV
jgi:16S rRNA (adenine1518-N6/adenine1519-N6)-dimethyltransferase